MKTIGVIGLGSIGMRHAKNLVAMGHKVLGTDPDDVCELAAASYGVSPLRGNLEELDAVVIASPTPTHAHYLSHAAQAGIHAFVEKPISGGIPEDIAKCLENMSRLKVMVGNNLRFHSCVKQAKEWMDEGLIGKPLWASFTVSQYNSKYIDPCILNWGAHEVDLALYLLGPADVTSAVGDHDLMDVCLLHKSGIRSTIHVDYLAPLERRSFGIIGTEGNIGVDLVNRTGWLKTTNTADQGVLSLPWEEGPEATVEFRIEGADCGSWDQDYKDEIQCFIDLIDGKPVPSAATGYDGLATLEIIEEARRKAGA